MDYEELSYEECFNKIFNEININKKSINKLNDIVTNQRKEIEELKNEIEDLKKYNKLKNMIEIDLKKEIEKIKEIETNERNKIFQEETNKNIYNLTAEIEEIQEIFKEDSEINIKKETEKIEIDIKKEIEELKNKVEYLIYLNEKEKKELEEYKDYNEEDIDCIDKRVERIEKYNKLRNVEVEENIKINNNINNEIIVLKEIIQNIQKNEIETNERNKIFQEETNKNISNFNIHLKENIEKYNKLRNVEVEENIKINNKINNEIIVLKETIQNIQKNEIETNERNKIFQEETNKNISNFNIHLKENIEKYNKLRNKIVKENIEKNNEIIVLKETIKNIQEKEIDYIYDNIANLNVEVEENIKINNNINNEIFELKEIKNNLHFSYVISSYNYHICYLKDIVKLEIDLFTKLINNNILPINFITPQGPNNIQCAVKYAIDNFTDKYELNKYLNDNDIIDNKYNFNLTEYISINNIKLKDLGKFNPHKKNTNNKYALQFFKGGASYKGSEINIQYKIISKNNFYKTLYNEKNELIIENNDFIKMIEMKEDIEEMEEMILDSLERYEFMKTFKNFKTNTIYLSDK